MRMAVLLTFLLLPAMILSASDFVSDGALKPRPALDKSAVRGMASIQANPWFPPAKHRVETLGGPDVAMQRFISGPNTAQEMWAQTAKLLKSYGLNAVEYEGNFEFPSYSLYKPVLDGFAASGTGLRVSLFVVSFGTAEQIAERAIRFFKDFEPLNDHPNLLKIDGRPVVQLYGFNRRMNPADWQRAVERIEAETGPKVWLVEMMDATPEEIRKWMPVMDGLFMYGNWNGHNQQEIFDRMVPVMHREFPEKIFMAAVQNVYANHFHYGGVAPRLLDKYLKSWQTTLAAKPDIITMTNLFDHYEHSLHLPSYAWENLMLRVSQNRLAAWREETPAATANPELFILNTANVIVGQKMYFDVISFPTESGKPVKTRLELVDNMGRQIHDFGEHTLQTDRMDIIRFELDSLPYVQYPVILPKLDGIIYQPGTRIVSGIRPWLLWYARSTANRIRLIPTDDGEHAPEEWFVNGQPGGSTLEYPEDGVINVTAYARPVSGNTSNDVGTSGGHVRLLRNGREIYSFDNWDLNFTREFTIPHPGNKADSYNLELENNVGGRFTTMPVFITANRRPGNVRLPVLHEGKVEKIDFPAERVPYFHYRFDRDRGLLVHDISGYSHNGFIGGKNYGGGSLQQTGFNHEHVGPVPNVKSGDPLFVDEEGGFLRFGGSGFVKLMGGTMPPYACTAEIRFRLSRAGDFGLLGTANNSMQLSINRDGNVVVSRAASGEGMGGVAPQNREAVNIVSRSRIKTGEWVHVAVVYDLQYVTLYINGVENGRQPSLPNSDHEWLNSMVIGGTGTFPYADPDKKFVGDISEVRIYGRNLAPDEFFTKR